MAKQTGRRSVQPAPPPAIRPTITVVQEETTTQTLHTGPIPAPDTFRAYGEVLKDAPDRILQMAEREAAHRQSREMWEVRSKAIQPHLGTIAGLVIGVVTVVSGANVAMSGHEASGFGVVLLGLTSLVGVFVTGKIADVIGKRSGADKPDK